MKSVVLVVGTGVCKAGGVGQKDPLILATNNPLNERLEEMCHKLHVESNEHRVLIVEPLFDSDCQRKELIEDLYYMSITRTGSHDDQGHDDQGNATTSNSNSV